MICKQCGSRLRENNRCLKCGYDNHYYVEKLPKHLEQLDKFMLEGIYGEDETAEAEDVSDMEKKPVNPQAVVTTQCSGNRQNSVNTYNHINSGNSRTPAPPNRSGKGPFVVLGIIGIVCIAIVAVTVGFFVGRDHKDSTVIAGQTQDTEMMSAETEIGNTLESDVNETEESETSQQSNYGNGYAESGNGTGKEQNNRNDRNLPGSGTGGSGISEQYNRETDADTTAETDRLRY